jgi:hypothetical protein
MRLVTMSDKNGNAGREFLKCESKAEPGKVGLSFPSAVFFLFSSILHFHPILELGLIFFLFRIWRNARILSRLMSTSG